MYANDDNTQRAREAGAEVINYEEHDDLVQLLKDMTGNLGPDSCCDAVGMMRYMKPLLEFIEQHKIDPSSDLAE